MKRITIMALAFAFLASGVALAVESANGTVFTSSPISVKSGQDFLIALPSNPTTGYSWSATATGGTVAIEGSAYQGPAASSKPRMGAGGQQIFILEALRSGSATVTFSYARPFEKKVKPVRTQVFKITVL